MGDIAARAGVGHGTVYTYFDTKEDLLAAAVEDLVSDLRESIRVVDAIDPVSRVAAANERYLTAYAANARLLRVVEEVAIRDSEFRSMLSDLRRTHVTRVASQIRRLQGEGAAVADLPPDTTAAALCAMVEGYARYWYESGRWQGAAAAAATLTRLWVRALGLPGATPKPLDAVSAASGT